MSQNRMNAPEKTKGEDQATRPAYLAEEELDRVADEAAQKAEGEEKAYDANHDIFTK